VINVINVNQPAFSPFMDEREFTVNSPRIHLSGPSGNAYSRVWVKPVRML